jgi:outer membrane protein assembly factor BamB
MYAAGYSWEGAGALLAVEDITETADSAQQGIAVRLSGIPSALFTSATLGNYQNRTAEVALVVFDADMAVIGDPVSLFRGLMDQDTVNDDGQQVAVVTRNNELVALRDGKVMWRKSMPAQSFTAPLVAGARIFVLTADRSVLAFDGATGRQLWTQQRPGEPLVLKQAGVMLAFKNSLVVGLSGRLTGLDPNTGVIRW